MQVGGIDIATLIRMCVEAARSSSEADWRASLLRCTVVMLRVSPHDTSSMARREGG